MGRLIDADALIARTYEAEKNVVKSSGISKMVMDAIRNEVNNQPTAYDVEKVVAELEYQKEHFEKDRTYWAEHSWKDNVVYNECDMSDRKADLLGEAIDIVKRGGVE